jgi:uncharacterized Zn finger protein
MTTLTENTIRSYTSSQSFARGLEYYQAGAIDNTFRQGNTLLADCEGTYTYRLRVELADEGVESASCTCPYEFDGYCKHIVALLLTYVHKPGEFVERKALPVLLGDVDKTALVVILTRLVDNHPELYGWLEMNLPPAASADRETAGSKAGPPSQVSEKVYRKRIKNILRPGGYNDDYDSAYGVARELDEITNNAEESLKAGDAQGAITILVTLLDELSDAYEMIDDSDGELADSADSAGRLLAESILSANLTARECDALGRRVAPSAENLSGYGIEAGLDVAGLALEYGWNEPEDDGKELIANLNTAKLNVLERQGRMDEFLSLCQQTGQHLRYVLKLLQLGRFDEAIRAANQILDPQAVLQVAQALQDANRPQNAITLAEQGLTLEGQKYHLAAWLAPLEESQERTEQALQAYLTAFASFPSLEIYKNIQRLSGERWELLKPDQMNILLQSGRPEVIAAVYLYEQEWDQAIAVAEKYAYNYDLREKVAEAVVNYRSDWVIQVAIREAEKLIEPTQSKHYPHAARWLGKAKQAYLQSGRKAEWLACLTRFKTTYARRPSLQKELAKL